MSLLSTARTRRLSAEAAWTFAGLFVQMVGLVATLKIATSMLGREDYGSLALLNSASSFVQLLLLAPLLQGASRQAPRSITEGNLDALLGVTRVLARGAWGLVLLVALVLLGQGVATDRWQLVALVPAGVVMVYADYRSLRTQTLQQAARARALLARHRIVENVGRAGLAALFLWRFPVTLSVPLAFATATLLSNAWFEPLTRKHLKTLSSAVASSFDAVASRRELLAFAAPIALGSLATWAQTSADRWFIERTGSLVEAGRYASAGQLASAPFAILAGLMITFASPILYAQADARVPRSARWITRMSWSYLAVGGAGLGLLVVLRRPLVHLLLGRAQWDCEPLVPFTAAGWMLFHWSQLPALSLMVAGKTSRMIVPLGLGGLVSATANAVLVPRYGAMGASWALLLSGAVRTVALFLASRCAQQGATWLGPIQREQLRRALRTRVMPFAARSLCLFNQVLGGRLCVPMVGRLLRRAYGDELPHWGMRIPVGDPAFDEVVVSALFFSTYEFPEVLFVREHLRPLLDVVELGASLGVVTAHAACMQAPGLRLIAVEANPDVLPVIREVVARTAPSAKLTVVHAAIAYGQASVYFERSEINSARVVDEPPPGDALKVRALTLRSLLREQEVGDYALLCDIEGAEAGLLSEDSAALVRCQQVIVECHESSRQGTLWTLPRYLAAFEGLGFVLTDRFDRSEALAVFTFERRPVAR